MDFQHDDSAFGTASTDEVHHMYVPGSDDRSVGGGDAGQTGYDGDQDAPGSGRGETVSVNVGGDEVTALATVDVDHDGRNETAVFEDPAGHHIALTDLDRDGRADHAALLDDAGHVVETAHRDQASGQWGQDRPGDRSPYGGPGSTLGDGVRTSPAGPASTGAGEEISVSVAGRRTELPASDDRNDDGRAETAVVEGVDGTRIAFTDHDGDGSADRATIFDPAGHLVGTAHYDPITGAWVEDPTG
jgi:hypothetical protein